MKILEYVWKVVINIITVIVVVSIFSVASSNFETVILAVLVLIYLSIVGFTSIWGMTQMEFTEALSNDIETLKRLITNKPDKNDLFQGAETLEQIRSVLSIPEDEDEKILKKEKADSKKTVMIKFYINSGFQFIIYVIALYNLISALS